MKKLLFVFCLLVGDILAQDIPLTSPATFSVAPYLDLNADRGGPEYKAKPSFISIEPGGGPRYGIDWTFTSNANQAVVNPETDVSFQAWNNSRSKPYFIYGVYAFPSVSAGSIQAIGAVQAVYSHNLQIGETSTLFLTFKEVNIFQPIVNEQRAVVLRVVNTKPSVSLEASPLKIAPGGTVAFLPATSDLDGHPVTLSYNYGDGSSGTEAFKTYSTPGTYTVTVSAFDGFDTTTAQIQIEVVGDAARVPVPRFTTSDVVGFVGVPLAFDAIYTTDPQNSIVAYSWNFGDGSAAGSGQQVSRTYTTAGSYLVTLTVIDGEGIQAKTARAIEILPTELLGTFNAGVEFKTVFDRTKTAKDSVMVKATLNVGDTQVGDGTVLALEIAGQRFEATLDRKLRAVVAGTPKQTWKAKAQQRKQAAGQVDLQITIRNCDVGLGFNQQGVLAGDNPVEATIIVRLEIGAKVFEVPTDASFQFNAAGTRAKGEGESE